MKWVLILALASVALAQKIQKKDLVYRFDVNRFFKKVSDRLSHSKLSLAFDDFMKSFNKKYFHPGEQESRRSIFSENIRKVLEHNNKKKVSYKMDVNEFSDMDFDEFKTKFLNRQIEKEIVKDFGMKFSEIPRRRLRERKLHKSDHKSDLRRLQNLKRKVDWSPHCTGIKDQKSCAACYAFSAVAGLEALLSIHRKKKETCSEQSMIDCIKTNRGCVAGSPARVINYVYGTGIARMANYPYIGKKQTCKSTLVRPTRGIKDNYDYDYLEKGIMNVLEELQRGPVIIVQTANDAFRNYKQGVFNDNECTEELDHSTLAVGYDLDHNPPYILIKNSWGTAWGDKGWIKIAIGEMSNANGGVCLIADHEYNMKIYFSEY